MRYEGSFVVETSAHVTTLYKPKEGGAPDELEFFDNTPRCFYDMERYGVDMCIIKSSGTSGSKPGPTNEIARLAELVDKYPDCDIVFYHRHSLYLSSFLNIAEYNNSQIPLIIIKLPSIS